jgi:hypothetical protein
VVGAMRQGELLQSRWIRVNNEYDSSPVNRFNQLPFGI